MLEISNGSTVNSSGRKDGFGAVQISALGKCCVIDKKGNGLHLGISLLAARLCRAIYFSQFK